MTCHPKGSGGSAGTWRVRLFFLFSGICAICGLLLGCAAQGPPRPPRVQVPERVKDLAAHQIGRSLEVSFTPPAVATDGEGFTKPLEVEIFREITSPGGAQSQAPRADPNRVTSAPAQDKPWVSLGAADLSRLARGERVVYVDHFPEQQFALSLGSTFRYKVRALTRGWRGRPVLGEISKPAVATLLDVSGPVQNLKVVCTEKALSLSWEAPARTLGGAPMAHLAGYRVYRSEQPKVDSFKPVGESKGLTFLDPHFQFGRTYCYKVRGVFKQGAQEAESGDGQPYQLTAKDVFPPATPQGLTALYTADVVELIWNANLEPDLAGYNVYRREEGKPAQRINRELVPTPIYRDSSIEARRRYFYQVTAVDLSGNQSDPSAEAQAGPPASR